MDTPDAGDTRAALAAMVAAGLLVVTTPADDPLDAVYRMPDPEGVAAALDALGAV